MKRRSFLQTLGALAAAVFVPPLPAVPAPLAPKVLKYTCGPGGDFTSLAACMDWLGDRNLIAENLCVDIEVLGGVLPDDGGPVVIGGMTTGPHNYLSINGPRPGPYGIYVGDVTDRRYHIRNCTVIQE